MWSTDSAMCFLTFVKGCVCVRAHIYIGVDYGAQIEILVHTAQIFLTLGSTLVQYFIKDFLFYIIPLQLSLL